MKRFHLLLIPMSLLFATPASTADLDGTVYREQRTTTVIEQAPLIERRIIEHRHYYEPAPRTVYIDEDYYAPPVYSYYDRPWRAGWRWRHRHFRDHWRGHRHYHRW